VEVFERREATATLGQGQKKWLLQVALDVSLRFLFRRNEEGGGSQADVDVGADAEAQAAQSRVSGDGGGDGTNTPPQSLPITPTRAREMEERGWAVRGEEPPPPVLQRMRERQEAAGMVVRRDEGGQEEEEGEKKGGLMGLAGAVAEGAWGLATGRWLWGGSGGGDDDANKAQDQQQQQQQKLAALALAPPAPPQRSPSRGASVGGKVTEGAGLHGVGGVGGSLIPHPPLQPAAETVAPAPGGPPSRIPAAPTQMGKNKAPPKQLQQPKARRGAIPLSPTAAVAATEPLPDGRAAAGAGAGAVDPSTPRDRKRDRLRRFLGALLRLPSGTGGQGGGGGARTRGGRGGVKGKQRQSEELARGLGLSEAETAGVGTARGFGGIGLAPDLGGPLRLRRLGKRERARCVESGFGLGFDCVGFVVRVVVVLCTIGQSSGARNVARQCHTHSLV
jgi:hypothetical protein